MDIVLTAVDTKLYDSWKKFCGDLPFVRVYLGSIFDAGCEAVVSPSNSFGFFDGGLDYSYSEYFGWDLGPRVQKKIKADFDGELLVGQALMVETNNPKIPYLVSAPTMRIPVELPKNSVNPYLAAKAALVCAKKNDIKTIAFPGLGTGIGKISTDKCALQVREAIEEIILGNWVFPISWQDALERHTYLYTGLRTVTEHPEPKGLDFNPECN